MYYFFHIIGLTMTPSLCLPFPCSATKSHCPVSQSWRTYQYRRDVTMDSSIKSPPIEEEATKPRWDRVVSRGNDPSELRCWSFRIPWGSTPCLTSSVRLWRGEGRGSWSTWHHAWKRYVNHYSISKLIEYNVRSNLISILRILITYIYIGSDWRPLPHVFQNWKLFFSIHSIRLSTVDWGTFCAVTRDIHVNIYEFWLKFNILHG